MFRPGIHALPEKADHSIVPRLIQIWPCNNQPHTLTIPRDLEHVHIRHTPNQERRQHSRQEQTGYATEGTFRDGHQSAFGIVGFALPDGLERAHVASYEGEDGDADAALKEDADNGPL